MSVDRLIRSVRSTLETLAPTDLADLCPRLAQVAASGAVPALAVVVVGDRLVLPAGERVVLRGTGLVRVHVALDTTDDRPLRHASGAQARVTAVAAGAGPLAVSDRRVVGVLRATTERPSLAYAMAWDEVDDVGPAPSGGVRLLATTLLGGLTIDLVASD